MERRTVMVSGLSKKKQLEDITLSSLVAIGFSLWPVFYVLWIQFKLTVSIDLYFPIWLLGGLALLSALLCREGLRNYLWFWLLFFGYAAAVSVRVLNKNVAIDLLVILFCVLLCIFLRTKKNIDPYLLIKCVFWCGVFIAFTVVLDNATGLFSKDLLDLYTVRNIEIKTGQRTTGGIFGAAGHSGGFISYAIGAYTVLQSRKGSIKLTVKNGIVYIFLIFSLIVVRKRGFVLFLLASLVFFLVLGIGVRARNRKRTVNALRVLFVVILLSVVLLVLYFEVDSVREGVIAMIDRFSADDTTLSGRMLLYELALNLFKTSPLIGIGWGRYRAHTLNIFGDSNTTFETHNVYLQLLCETGVIGLAIFLVLVGIPLFLTIRRCRRLQKEGAAPEIVAVLRFGLFLQVFFLLYCLSGNPLYDYDFLAYYFLGILISQMPLQGERYERA